MDAYIVALIYKFVKYFLACYDFRMESYDDWHYDYSEIDGYNAPINFIDSCRGTGKTTIAWRKSWAKFQQGKKTIVQTRLINSITDIFIETIHDQIAKFAAVPAFKYAKKDMGKEGMVDIYCDGKKYIRVIAIAKPLRSLKNMFLSDVGLWIADEYICNERLGEKYVKGEAFKFKEAWTTFYRENHDMKAYFLGNPYSSYNPYFSEFGIDSAKLRPGVILSGGGKDPAHPLWAAQNYRPNAKLLAELMKNPLYADEMAEYTRYALNGESVNDANIFLMPSRPANYSLRFFFKMDGRFLAVWRSNDFESPKYWCGFEKEIGKHRDVYCFDFKELSERTVFFSGDERSKFGDFRMAVRNRDVAFESVECDYLVEEIYPTL